MHQKQYLRVRIFLCRNALKEHLPSRRLEELCLPESADVEQVPCLGKIDPRYLLRAFETGCDAVCLVGCAIGTCSTMDGNLRAHKRIGYVQGILEEIGIKRQRLALFLREPLDEHAVQAVVDEFLCGVRALGPSELRTGKQAGTP